MNLIGIDDFSRPVYKCVETGTLYKDVELGNQETPELCDCSNDFNGEPCSPISKDLDVRFNDKVVPDTNKNKFNYQLLGRLQSDCKYYLGNGNKQSKFLWAQNEKEQIEKMKSLYASFSDEEKPEWISLDEILSYEADMV